MCSFATVVSEAGSELSCKTSKRKTSHGSIETLTPIMLSITILPGVCRVRMSWEAAATTNVVWTAVSSSTAFAVQGLSRLGPATPAAA
jgi:hypothetical protein